MDRRTLGIYRKKLLRAKERAESRITVLEETSGFDRPESDWAGELSSYDNHTADSSSALEMRSINLGLINHSEDRLAQIDAALDRVDKGVYGKCVQCGRDIPLERLDAIPWAASCATCGVRQPSSAGMGDARPIEEEVIRPPFGGVDPARAYDDPGVHGEDIWDALASYGNANSPQDDEASYSGDVDSH